MNDEELEMYREYFSQIICKEWFKRLEEHGIILTSTPSGKTGFFFEKHVSPMLEPPKDVNWRPGHLAKIEDKVYGESPMKKIIEMDFAKPIKNPFLGKAFKP